MRTTASTGSTEIASITDTTRITDVATATATTTPIDPDALAASLAQAVPNAGALDELQCGQLSAELSAGGHIDAAIAWERLVRHAQAGLIRSLGALARDAVGEGGLPLMESELSAALAWPPSGAQTRLHEAETLTRLFPATLDLLSEGRVSVEQARSLVQLTFGLEDEVSRAVQARVLERMVGQSVAATRQAIRRAVVRADPQAAANRHRYERARRRVELRAEDDGMATLSFYLPADVAQMAMRTLTELAQNAKRKNKNSSDKRTLDQRRADLLPALLHRTTIATGSGTATRSATGTTTTGTNAGTTIGGATFPLVPARVSVVVGIETLLGLTHEPGHLEGYGPICAEQARRIAHAHTARWRFLLTATDGTPALASDRSYSPRAAIKRLTELKYTTCAFPHCAMPADRCDLDHNQPYHKGGPTSADNLAPLCRRHHNHKSQGDWDLHRHGDNIRWTSKRTGRSYTTAPTQYQPVPAA